MTAAWTKSPDPTHLLFKTQLKSIHKYLRTTYKSFKHAVSVHNTFKLLTYMLQNSTYAARPHLKIPTNIQLTKYRSGSRKALSLSAPSGFIFKTKFMYAQGVPTVKAYNCVNFTNCLLPSKLAGNCRLSSTLYLHRVLGLK